MKENVGHFTIVTNYFCRKAFTDTVVVSVRLLSCVLLWSSCTTVSGTITLLWLHILQRRHATQKSMQLMTIDSAAAPPLKQTTEQILHPPQMHPLSAANGKYHCKSPLSAKSCRGHSRANTAPAQLPALHYSNTRYQHNNTQSRASKPNVKLFFYPNMWVRSWVASVAHC